MLFFRGAAPAAMAAILLWASGPAVVKITLAGVSVESLHFFGTALATLFLFFVLLFTGRLSVLRSLKARDVISMCCLGGLGVFAYLRLHYECIAVMPVQEAQVLNYLWPALTVLFSALWFSNRVSLLSVLGLSLSFLGVVVAVIGGQGFGSFTGLSMGVIYGLAAACCYAAYSAFSRQFKIDKIVMSFCAYLSGSLIAGVWYAINYTPPHISAASLPGVMWIGIGAYGLAGMLWLIALERGNVDSLASLAYFTPCLSFFFIYALVGEEIAAASYYGIFLVIAGAIVQKSEPLLERLRAAREPLPARI